MSLSGGQKQRVAIASALLTGKRLLVFDEPTSGLDFRSMERTAELLKSLENDITVLIVTHDMELIERCCTHILHIENWWYFAENHFAKLYFFTFTPPLKILIYKTAVLWMHSGFVERRVIYVYFVLFPTQIFRNKQVNHIVNGFLISFFINSGREPVSIFSDKIAL